MPDSLPELSLDDLGRLFKEIKLTAIVYLISLAMWAVKGCEEHGMELVYQDDELMVFRRKVKLSELGKEK